ncbi:MAG: putative serine/threonine-protein kinase [Satyrvirus sp.]|uniref:Putative serine/threonine-protein kinase n=1 Tax=Satyrvirus sp. TaxID=2487771 RepID=A0A3G5AHZ3_9VIRU|nr:MAG: putative serine/threonine-protein kinase [Satyrvirus sp.]
MNKNQSKKKDKETKCKIEYSNSDEDDDDSYQNVLQSNLLSLYGKSDKNSEYEKKPTETRIEFVKNLLVKNKINSMIDFDNCNTEMATSTRLDKKIINIKDFITSMNVDLIYIKSGSSGHIFKATSKTDPNVIFAVKVCAYPKDIYGHINNSLRPENAELRMLKLLGYFVIKRTTPHFVLPVCSFNTSITNFIKIPPNINLNNDKNNAYKEFIERYNNNEFEDLVSVLVSEWCNGGDLLDYIRKNYKDMTTKEWVVIIFQILVTLAKIQLLHPPFRHNDMKANNILIHFNDNKNKPNSKYKYVIGDTYFIIPDIGFQIKIWDFDFASIDGIIENNKLKVKWTNKMNITQKKNQYYDMHYFFNTLISKRFFQQFYEGGAPQEIIDFVHRIIPEKYRNIPEEYRIIINNYDSIPKEYVTIMNSYSNIPDEYCEIITKYCTIPNDYLSIMDIIDHIPEKYITIADEYYKVSYNNRIINKNALEKYYKIPQKYRLMFEKYHNIPEEYKLIFKEYCDVPQKYISSYEKYHAVPEKLRSRYDKYQNIPKKYYQYAKLINRKGRIQVNEEYKTPYEVILNDPLFEKYRFR